MRARKVIVVVESDEDYQYLRNESPNLTLVNVTELIDLSKYPELPRAGIGERLSESMPKDSHQFVCVVLAKEPDESDDAWEIRAWSHPVISIMIYGFQHSVCFTKEFVQSLASPRWKEARKNLLVDSVLSAKH